MKVYFIGAGPGDPELITLKGKKILERAGYCLYAGSLINPEILGYTKKGTKLYNSATMSLEGQLNVVEEARQKGEDVARIHSGDPSIYGAIQEQMRELDARGIGYEVVPGVSSFTAAASSLRQELTLPGVTQSVVLTRLEGKTSGPSIDELKMLAQSRPTLCIFLSINQIEKLVETLLPFYGQDCPAAVVFKSTWKDEKILRAPFGEIASKVRDEGIEKTAIMIVGRVLSRDHKRSFLYSPK